MKEKYYFSAKNLSFYPGSMREVYEAAGTWPEDAVQITEAQYLKLRSCEEGRQLQADKSGKPRRVVVDITPEQVERQNLSRIKKAIDSATAAIVPYQFAEDTGEATEEESAKLLEYKLYIVKLHRLKKGDLTKELQLPSPPEEV